MNDFRTRDGSLDRIYLRVCAIWRLLKSGRIDWKQAHEYAARPIKGNYGRGVDSTVAIWERSNLARESLNMPPL